MGAGVREGVLHGGLPELATGAGPPLLFLGGLAPEHRNPAGFERWWQLRMVRPLAERFTVHVVALRPRLAPTTTMADLAVDVAGAIRHDLGGRVPVVGLSTGGSVAQQLAVDHPDVVERLVLVASACRLSPRGRHVQRRLAELTGQGRPRPAWATVGSAMGATHVGGQLMAAAMWLTGPLSDPPDPRDLIATIEAEDRFDVTDRLHRITAPTLLVAGGRDRLYGERLFLETARGIPDARLLLYPRKGHAATSSPRLARRQILRFLTGVRDDRAAQPA